LDELLRALALVLVIEGLLPFLTPKRFRQGLLDFARLDDRWMRGIGLGAMCGGLLLLQALK
jgi:uncharacterized protein YjeT (DUF2065 family)